VTAGTRLLERDIEIRIARTGQPKWDKQNGTGSMGQFEQDRTEQVRQDRTSRKQNRLVRIGQSEIDS
jgi:hypothetical protein